MTKFHCTSCNYEFEVKEGKPPKKCPFCGRMGTVRREKSAAELLNEVDAIMRDEHLR